MKEEKNNEKSIFFRKITGNKNLKCLYTLLYKRINQKTQKTRHKKKEYSHTNLLFYLKRKQEEKVKIPYKMAYN